MDSEFYTHSELQQFSGVVYGVSTNFVKRNGTATYRSYAIGGQSRLPEHDYELVCANSQARAEVRVYALKDAESWTCPDMEAASILSGGERLTGRPLVLDLYRDEARQFYIRHIKRLVTSDSPITLKFTFSDKRSFVGTLVAVLHETFHIHHGLKGLGLSGIDEEINAQLFGMCQTTDANTVDYIAARSERATKAIEETTFINRYTDKEKRLESRRDLESLLQAITNYKDRYYLDEPSEASREVQYVYQYFPDFILEYLAFDESGSPTPERFDALCSRLWEEEFSEPLTMAHIERADAVIAAE